MYSAQTPAAPTGPRGWFARTEGWMDDRGKPAWIAATILGFIIFWPVGLGYTIWSKRMFTRSSSRSGDRSCRPAQSWDRRRNHGAYASSGNTAFDAYKADTLRRLEEEQQAFESFLQRLREAKDKSEFDAFMDDRSRAAARGNDIAPPTADATGTGAY
jgi:hypothetical protein